MTSTTQNEQKVKRMDSDSWRKPPPIKSSFDNPSCVTVASWDDLSRKRRDYLVDGNGVHHTVAIALCSNPISLRVNGKLVFQGINVNGNVHISSPEDRTALCVDRPLRSVHVHIPQTVISSSHQELTESGDPDHVQLRCGCTHDPALEHISRALLHSKHNQMLFPQIYLDTLVASFVVRLLQCHTNRRSETNFLSPQLLSWQFARVVEYIDSHFSENITLRELASQINLSPSYFAAVFKRSSGLRPHDYILRTRILKAESLLIETDMPLAEIALTVGFANQSHFSTVFKRYNGHTPTSGRRQSLLNRGIRAVGIGMESS